MGKITNKNTLTILNFLICFYLIGLFLLNEYKIDHVLIGVLRELLTIPSIVLLPVFLFMSIKMMLKEKIVKLCFLLSVLSTLICLGVIIKSFV